MNVYYDGRSNYDMPDGNALFLQQTGNRYRDSMRFSLRHKDDEKPGSA